MSVSYQIDSGRSLVDVRLRGTTSGPEILAMGEQLLADPALRPGLSVLSDHSELEQPATTPLVKGVVASLQAFVDRIGPFRCAVVVPSDASFGMARMSEALADPIDVEIRAFRSRSEALAWLGVDEP